MKKVVKIMLAVATLVLSSIAVFACGKEEQHSWDADNIAWSWDGVSAATATFKCKDDASHTQTVNATITNAVTKEATCSEAGVRTYTATATLDDVTYYNTKDEAIAQTEHSWDENTISWSWDGVTKATATLTCKYNAAHTYPLEAQVTDTVAVEPTCEEDGTKNYTATVNYNGSVYKSVKSETIAKTGHNYDTSNITWTWNSDNTAATATFACKNNSAHTQSVEAKVTSSQTAATCEKNGSATYNAVANFGGKDYTANKSITIAATGHNYDFENISWTWDGLTKATATVVCKDDKTHIGNFVATGDDIVKTVKVEATCDDAGSADYTATVTYNNKKYTDVKHETIAEIGHDYDTSNVTWAWNSDNTAATATFACKNNSTHTHSVDAKVTSTQTPVTCEKDGLASYDAVVTVDGKDYKDNKSITTAATGHDYDFENISWTWDGLNKATATVICKNDKTHINNLVATGNDIEKNVKVEATCDTDGVGTYVATVTYNDKTYSDTKEDAAIPAIGHDYESAWTWSEDNSAATITLTCRNNSEHVTTKEAAVTSNNVAATCEKEGSTSYSASVRYDGKKYTDDKLVTLPALGHDYDEDNPTWNWKGNVKAYLVISCKNDASHTLTYEAKVEKVETAATCTEDGEGSYVASIEYKGQTITDKKDKIVLPATGHDYESVWTWNADKTAATLTLTCHNNTSEEPLTGQATVTQTSVANTCTTDGYTAYLATVEINGETYTNTTDKTIVPQTGHSYDYENVTWTWDGTSKATAVVSCSNNRTHTLSYAAEVVTADKLPTCTANGYTAYQANATINGKVVTSPITGKVSVPATGHTLTSQTTAVATCTTRGAVKFTCSNCDYEKTEYSNVIDHDWNIAAPTCTEAQVCNVCHTSIAALGHDYQSQQSATVSTTASGNSVVDCEEGQSVTYVCSRGDDTYEEVITPKKEHTVAEGGWTKSGDAVKINGETCKYTQLYVATCTVCGKSLKKTEEEENHNYTITVATAATCTKGGQKLYTCADCDSYFYQSYDKVDDAHNWVADKEGGSTYTCSYDSAHKKTVITSDTTSKEVAASDLTSNSEIALSNASITMDEATLSGLGSATNISVAADDNVDKSSVNLTDEQKKQIGDSKIYNLTLTADGKTVSEFGENAYVTVKVPYELGKDEDPNNIGIWYINNDGDVVYIEASYVVDATGSYAVFKTNHFSYYTVTKLTPAERCKLYGHNDKETPVGFKSYTNSKEYTIVTCTKEAYVLKVCQRCGRTEKVVINAAKQHTYPEENIVETKKVTCTDAGTTLKTCSICQDVTEVTSPALGHSWKQDVAQSGAATCTAAGKNVYVCTNDEAHTYTTILPQKSHNYKKTVVAATCEQAGYTTYTCAYCDDTYKADETIALGHDYVSVYYEHIQEEVGYTVYTCVNDSEHNYTMKDAAIGHVWNIEHATCVDDQVCTICGAKGELKTGLHSRNADTGICTVCGIGCIGHEFDVIEEVKGSCTTDGYKKEECLICHYVKITSTPATGHSGKYICSNCGESLVGEDLFYNIYNSIIDQDLTIVIDNIDVVISDASSSDSEVAEGGTSQDVNIGNITTSSTSSSQSYTSLKFIELALGFDNNGKLYATGYGEISSNYGDMPFDQVQTFQAVIKEGKIYVYTAYNSNGYSGDQYGAKTAVDQTNEYIAVASIEALSNISYYQFAAYMTTCYEWLNSDILPLVKGMAAISKNDINTMSLTLAETFLNLSVNNNGGYTITLNWDGIQAINDSLYSNDIAATIDLILGDGSYNAICDEIGTILAMPVGDIMATLQDKGIVVSDLLTAANHLASQIVGDNVTVQDLLDNFGVTQMLDAVLGTENVRITDILSIDNDTTVIEYINIVMNAMSQNNNGSTGSDQGNYTDQGGDGGQDGSMPDGGQDGNMPDMGGMPDGGQGSMPDMGGGPGGTDSNTDNGTANITAESDENEEGEEENVIDTAAQIKQLVEMLKQVGTYNAYELIAQMTNMQTSTLKTMVDSVIGMVSEKVSVTTTLSKNGTFQNFNINVTKLTVPTGSSVTEVTGGVSVVANYVSDIDYNSFLTETKSVADLVTFDRSFAAKLYGADGYIDAANLTEDSDTTKPVINFYESGAIKSISFNYSYRYVYYTDTYTEKEDDVKYVYKYEYTSNRSYTMIYYFPEVPVITYRPDCGSWYQLSIMANKYEIANSRYYDGVTVYKNGEFYDEKIEHEYDYDDDGVRNYPQIIYCMYNSATGNVTSDNLEYSSTNSKHNYYEDASAAKLPEGCTGWGARYYVCILCGDSYVEYYCTGHQHIEESYVLINGEGSSCEDGVKVIETCTDCGEVVYWYMRYYHIQIADAYYELINGEGSSCEDGVKEITKCDFCGQVVDEYTYDWHRTFTTNKISLTEYAPEGCTNKRLYIYTYSCLCGEDKGVSFNGFNYYNSYNTDGSRTEIYTCWDECGLMLTSSYVDVPSEEQACKITRTYTLVVSVDGNNQYTYQYEKEIYSHRTIAYGTLVKGEGSSCVVDGLTITYKCVICGETTSKNTVYSHRSVVIFEQDLAEYGAKCGEKLYVSGDICDNREYLYIQIYDSEGVNKFSESVSYNWEYWYYNGTCVYTCSTTDCELKLAFIVTRDTSNCVFSLAITSGCDDEGKDGTKLVSGIYIVTKHNYEIDTQKLTDETKCLYDIIYKCNTCGKTYTKTDVIKHNYSSVDKLVDSSNCSYERTYTCSVCGDTYTSAFTSHSTKYITIKAATCTQYGLRKEYCINCNTDFGTYKISPRCHNYKLSDEYEAYVCTICGLQSAKNANGDVILEDVTGIEGDGITADDYVIGYYMRGNEDDLNSYYIPQLTLIIYKGNEEDDIDTVIVDSVSVEKALEDQGNYVKFNFKAVQNWADAYFTEKGYSSDQYTYEVSLTFNPKYGNNNYDAAITFDGTHVRHVHEFEEKYILLGTSCKDGVQVQKICKSGDKTIKQDPYYYHRITEEKIDLSQYLPENCSYNTEEYKVNFYATRNTCACNQENYIEIYGYFNIANREINDNEWVSYYFCQDGCGLIFALKCKTTHSADKYCDITYSYSVVYISSEEGSEEFSETTLISTSQQVTEHSFLNYSELNGTNTNCYQGITVTQKCRICGYEKEPYTTASHYTSVLYELDLKDYGATCGEKFYVLGDICGYYGMSVYLYYNDWQYYSFSGDNYYDEATESYNYINIYTCPNEGCSLSIAYTWISEGCDRYLTIYNNYDSQTHKGDIIAEKTYVGKIHSTSYSSEITDKTKCEWICTYTCKYCDYKYSYTYILHDYVETTKLTDQSSCEYTTTDTCSRCGDTDSWTYHDHDYVSTATCTQYGSGTRTCSKCGDSFYNYDGPKGHNFNNGVCTRCGLLGKNYDEGAVVIEDLTGKVTSDDISENDKVLGYYMDNYTYDYYTPTITIKLYNGNEYVNTITVSDEVAKIISFEMESKFAGRNDTFVRFNYKAVLDYVNSLVAEDGEYAGDVYQITFAFVANNNNYRGTAIAFTDGTYVN